MTKFAFFEKLMIMLVFPEDLNKKCQVLEKWQPFSFLCVFLYIIGIISMYCNKK